MGDLGEMWNDLKDHKRKQKDEYECGIAPMIDEILKNPECKQIGDHWRLLGEWDFWWTGTVVNIKTREKITIEKLYVISHNSQVK